MTRKIETRIINALRDNAPFKSGRDEVRTTATGMAYYLHGHLVASKTHGKPLEPYAPTFRAWPTATTASRFRALGFDATIRKGVPHLDGVPL